MAATCTTCGTENPQEARFCFSCGTPLEALAAPARETRKVVTVLFSDVTGSTALGERLDPESMRRVMTRYFDAMSAVLERHGGTVEKFVGDAVMAVFGIPTLHEDDAVRAVRAAAEMRETLAVLNDELDREFGVRIEARTGINTGEVVTADAAAGQRLATGDSVNVAARLEQAAAPGDILLGHATFGLVRAAVTAEPVEPLTLKGKSEPVASYRLLDVLAEAPGYVRRLDAPLVGRERERRLLSEAFERSAADRACHLFTLLGAAGVGKSRLAAELLADVGSAAIVVRGRCLPYGEGITFWPLVELVSQLDIAAALSGVEDAEVIQRRIGSVTGAVEPAGGPEETFWAVRKLFEALARERPLVVLLDDLHWAEPTFLDLVEHVADWSRDAPLLLLCLGRPELLELRPTWGGGKLNATSILLEPLSDGETTALIEGLLGASVLDEVARVRIRDAAEGNPLFVEQMVAMLNENGRGAELAVPPTIQALLAARLDRLPREERAAVERASIEGKVFHEGAVRELTPLETRDRVGGFLLSLLRKQLITPGESQFASEQAFRFAHLLIRDAAYEALPKQERSELHERFAAWFERAAGPRQAEYEEILAYHLEQAYRYRAELGPVDDKARALAGRAAERLAAAAGRARDRRDLSAAASLFNRAASLLPDQAPERVDALTELGFALGQIGRLEEAGSVLHEAIALATARGEAALEARARVERARVRLHSDPSASLEAIREEVEAAVEMLERSGDAVGLARARTFLGTMQFFLGNGDGAREVFELAVRDARAVGAAAEEAAAARWKAVAAAFGSTPATEALRLAGELYAASDSPRSDVAAGMVIGAQLEAMLGHVVKAHALAERGLAIARDLGPDVWLVGAIGHNLITAKLLGGRAEEAERIGRENVTALERLGETGFLSTTAGFLAQALAELGRDDEAEHYSRLAETNASADDFSSQMGWRTARAPLLARRGELDEAERLAREAVEIAERTDFLNEHGAALVALGDVLARAGREQEAAEAYAGAIALYERKENVAAASRTRDRLAALEGAEV